MAFCYYGIVSHHNSEYLFFDPSTPGGLTLMPVSFTHVTNFTSLIKLRNLAPAPSQPPQEKSNSLGLIFLYLCFQIPIAASLVCFQQVLHPQGWTVPHINRIKMQLMKQVEVWVGANMLPPYWIFVLSAEKSQCVDGIVIVTSSLCATWTGSVCARTVPAGRQVAQVPVSAWCFLSDSLEEFCGRTVS